MSKEIKDEAYYIRTGKERATTLETLKMAIQLYESKKISHQTLLSYINKYGSLPTELTITLPRQSGKSTIIKNMALGIKDKRILILTQSSEQMDFFKELKKNNNIQISSAFSMDLFIGKKYDIIFFDDIDLYPNYLDIREKILLTLNNNGIIFFLQNDPLIEQININNDNSIINSLKRLERMADDKSKTAQKLIRSANEIGNKIVKILKDQYPLIDSINLKFKNDEFDYFVKSFEYTSPILFNEKRKVAYYDFNSIQCSDSKQSIFLSQYKQCNIEEAIFLAKDLKNGLLDFIYEVINNSQNNIDSNKTINNDDISNAIDIFDNLKLSE